MITKENITHYFAGFQVPPGQASEKFFCYLFDFKAFTSALQSISCRVFIFGDNVSLTTVLNKTFPLKVSRTIFFVHQYFNPMIAAASISLHKWGASINTARWYFLNSSRFQRVFFWESIVNGFLLGKMRIIILSHEFNRVECYWSQLFYALRMHNLYYPVVIFSEVHNTKCCYIQMMRHIMICPYLAAVQIFTICL